MISALMKMLGRVIGEHLRLYYVPGHELAMIHADIGMMEQVLMNLCVNARDAMPHGGELTIETESVSIDEAFCKTHPWGKPGRFVLLRISDTGCGMDAETRERIWEPFFTTKEVGEGTGMGLATVYGIVKQHDGMIHVYSEEGNGTSFKVYLPVAEGSAEDAKVKIEEPVVGGSEIILMAEDDESVMKLTRSILKQAGYTVLVARDGVEALAMFKERGGEIDLALLDVVMPNLGGREVYDRLKAVRPDLPVLFLSGYSKSATHTRFILEDGMHLINKPVQKRDLLRKVRELLDAER